MIDYAFRTTPFEHQKEVFLLSRDKPSFALLMEQGTGKSKVIIDTAAWLYGQGKINLLFIIAPNGIHRNWVINEIPTHMPDYIDYEMAFYSSSMKVKERKQLQKATEHKGLKIVSMNVEALATKKGASFAKELCLMNNTLIAIDESTTIKNHKALRTKVALKLGGLCDYRRILTGTPITQGPLDAFSQFGFLDPNIIGESSFYAFRNRYAILREMKTSQRSFLVVDSYVNLDELKDKLAPFSYRCLKADCLDLPDKLYQKRYIPLSKNQRKIYDELKKESRSQWMGKTITVDMALTCLLRLQQITGGFLQSNPEVDFDEEMNPIINESEMIPIDAKNERIEEIIKIAEETEGKIIIWARFRIEIDAICKRLKEKFGPKAVVEYHGGIDDDTRVKNIDTFQNDQRCRFFIGNVATAGKGITLTAATTVVYYSNTFSLEDRLQSEDRPHRIGQTHNVTYIDLVAMDTVDERIVSVLRSKKEMSNIITGDAIIDWL